MTYTTGVFTSPVDGLQLATYAWGDELTSPRGVVQLSHGLAEHSGRYDRFATALVAAGYRVRSTDHRGHGHSIPAGGVPGDFGPAGFPGLIEDVAAYGASVAEPHLPLVLFAHSMGSFAAQSVLLDHSKQYAAAVLTGSSVLDVIAANLAGAGESAGLEGFNAGFENRTGFEWLSRDTVEVDKYVADPLCGFDLPEPGIAGMFVGMDRLADPDSMRTVRPDLPILIASGSDDPLSGQGQLVQLLGQRYRDAGVADVTVTVYPEARHEILNETNRDDITADIISWIQSHA